MFESFVARSLKENTEESKTGITLPPFSRRKNLTPNSMAYQELRQKVLSKRRNLLWERLIAIPEYSKPKQAKWLCLFYSHPNIAKWR
jgi:hypothetical protein